jgi:hypothetical protein
MTHENAVWMELWRGAPPLGSFSWRRGHFLFGREEARRGRSGGGGGAVVDLVVAGVEATTGSDGCTGTGLHELPGLPGQPGLPGLPGLPGRAYTIRRAWERPGDKSAISPRRSVNGKQKRPPRLNIPPTTTAFAPKRMRLLSSSFFVLFFKPLWVVPDRLTLTFAPVPFPPRLAYLPGNTSSLNSPSIGTRARCPLAGRAGGGGWQPRL